MQTKKPYFGGTGATLEKFCIIHQKIGVDGTNYKSENWFKEISVFESLKPGDKVWIPYGGTQKYGKFKRIEWATRQFKHYGYCTPETQDWWYYEPYLIVEYNGNEYYVYEYSFYCENWTWYKKLTSKSWYERWLWSIKNALRKK